MDSVRTAAFLYDSVGVARAHPKWLHRGNGYAVWMHGVEAWENLRPEHERVFRSARLVLVNSRYTLDRFEHLHGALPNAVICPLALDGDEPTATRRKQGPPTVLIVGRMDTREGYKGHRELIHSWPLVRSAVPDARLIIVGDGDGRAGLEALAESMAPSDAVTFLGFVPESDMQDVWDEATLFSMPSRGEGFGLVYLEAMRQRLAVVASIHDAGAEINLHGVTGLNVDLDRSGNLAESLIQLLRDPARCRIMGDAGQTHWRDDYSYTDFARRFLHAFDHGPA